MRFIPRFNHFHGINLVAVSSYLVGHGRLMYMLGIFGQSKKFQQQLDAKWKKLYRIAYSWCHDSQLASDLVQDSLTKALKNRSQIKDVSALDAWLYKILVNCWRDYCKQRKNMVDIDDVTLVQEVDHLEEKDRLCVVKTVRTAISKLSFDQRQVITLVDLGELPYTEVADILDIPIGTVMSRLCRARRNLKEHLQEVEIDVRERVPNIWRVK